MAFCSQCGRKLADGANYCFECGNQVGQPPEAVRRTVFSGEVHKCPQCGEVLNAYEVCCGTCGYELRGSRVSASVQKFSEQLKNAITEYQKASIIQSFPIPNNKEDIFEFLILATSSIDRNLNKAVLNAWISKIEQSYRKAQLVLREEEDLDQAEDIYAEAQEKIQDLTHERIQQKKMPSLPQEPKKNKKRSVRWTPMTTIGMALGFVMIIVAVLIGSQGAPTRPHADEMAVSDEVLPGITIEQGKEYTFGANLSELYVARAISDTVIKVEKWTRSSISLQKEYSLSYEIGAYKINDPQSGFYWLDDQHSAFRLLLKDPRELTFGSGKEIFFTESWVDGDRYKGSNCLDDVFYYEHLHGDFNLYKAVRMSDGLLKIECWYRHLPKGEFHYGYDVCVIEPDQGDMGLQWSDEEKSSFTINLQDRQNSSLKKPVFVVFEEAQ